MCNELTTLMKFRYDDDPEMTARALNDLLKRIIAVEEQVEALRQIRMAALDE